MIQYSRTGKLAAIATLLLTTITAAAGEVTPFSSMPPGPVGEPWRQSGWRNFPPTEFRIIDDAGTRVVEANSAAAVAALTHDLSLDPATFRSIQWRWRVANLIEASDIYTKAGDDYPVRVYVTFDYDVSRLKWFDRVKLRLARLIYGDRVPTAALCYVWDRDAPAGTIAPNAYTDRIRMIVVESGAARLNHWIEYDRDLVADYQAAFGEAPPSITGVAIATDTDDTGEKVTAWYGDIDLINESSVSD